MSGILVPSTIVVVVVSIFLSQTNNNNNKNLVDAAARHVSCHFSFCGSGGIKKMLLAEEKEEQGNHQQQHNKQIVPTMPKHNSPPAATRGSNVKKVKKNGQQHNDEKQQAAGKRTTTTNNDGTAAAPTSGGKHGAWQRVYGAAIKPTGRRLKSIMHRLGGRTNNKPVPVPKSPKVGLEKIDEEEEENDAPTSSVAASGGIADNNNNNLGEKKMEDADRKRRVYGITRLVGTIARKCSVMNCFHPNGQHVVQSAEEQEEEADGGGGKVVAIDALEEEDDGERAEEEEAKEEQEKERRRRVQKEMELAAERQRKAKEAEAEAEKQRIAKEEARKHALAQKYAKLWIAQHRASKQRRAEEQRRQEQREEEERWRAELETQILTEINTQREKELMELISAQKRAEAAEAERQAKLQRLLALEVAEFERHQLEADGTKKVPTDDDFIWALTEEERQHQLRVLCSQKVLNIIAGGKNGEMGEMASLSWKSAIRFALRKYLCDQMFPPTTTEKEAGGGGGWTRSGLDVGQSVRNGQVAKDELLFARSDPRFPHAHSHDFKFTVFYPNEFRALWTRFGIDTPSLLESLTYWNLDGFENPAKGGSKFFTSWDGKFFLKSVLMQPKPLLTKKDEEQRSGALAAFDDWLCKQLEPSVEKDFFFQHVPANENVGGDASFLYWTGAERVASRNYRGAFLDYLAQVEEMGRHGINSLLPKFYMLFKFEQIRSPDNDGSGGHVHKPIIFTIQNGLLPRGIPQIDYKFDLKGSSMHRLLDEMKAVEKFKKNVQPTWMDLNFVQHRLAGGSSNSGRATEQPTDGFFPNGISIAHREWEELRAMLERDSEFLAQRNIVDYSLLLNVHFVEENANEEDSSAKYGGIRASCTNCRQFVPDGAIDQPPNESTTAMAAANGNEERRELRIFYGIIDMFQAYIPKKTIESMGKGLGSMLTGNGKNTAFPMSHEVKHRPMSIIEPNEYKRRFVDFLTSVVFRIAKEEEAEEGEDNDGRR